MSAIWHYLEAEKLAKNADELLDDAAKANGEADAVAGFHMAIARAQVHATLALAGATALQAYSTGNEDELTTWEDIAGGDEDS